VRARRSKHQEPYRLGESPIASEGSDECSGRYSLLKMGFEDCESEQYKDCRGNDTKRRWEKRQRGNDIKADGMCRKRRQER
jgi:hypothetical protein